MTIKKYISRIKSLYQNSSFAGNPVKKLKFRVILFLVVLFFFSISVLNNKTNAQQGPATDSISTTVTDTTTATTAITAVAPPPETVTEPEPSLPQGVADIIWLCLSGFLVFFMQAGFAMVETGLTRAKNAVNIMMKNLLDFAFGAILFWAVGYAIMYSSGDSNFLGFDSSLSFLGSFNAPTDLKGYAGSAAWLFQVVFAATAATIVSGAMAERTKLASYLVYSMVISAIIYPISGHWIWGVAG